MPHGRPRSSCRSICRVRLHANGGKRLVRDPKLLLRDSGLVHVLLGLADAETVLGD